MARGNGPQLLFHEGRDYQRKLDGLEKTVERTGWEVFAFAWMPNHIPYHREASCAKPGSIDCSPKRRDYMCQHGAADTVRQ